MNCQMRQDYGVHQIELPHGVEFPGGPVVRTLCSHCQGPGVRFLVGELRSHKLCTALHPTKFSSLHVLRRKLRCGACSYMSHPVTETFPSTSFAEVLGETCL